MNKVKEYIEGCKVAQEIVNKYCHRCNHYNDCEWLFNKKDRFILDHPYYLDRIFKIKSKKYKYIMLEKRESISKRCYEGFDENKGLYKSNNRS